MTKEVATQDKANNLKSLLVKARVEIMNALPKHIEPDRMLRIALTCARINPELLDATPESFLGAVIQSAQLGLEPGHSLGHAYLLVFRNGKTGNKEVSFIPGYRGLMDLVYRAPDHPTMMPQAVYEGDKFHFALGTAPFIEHIPAFRQDKAKLTHAYCIASFPGGRKEFIAMSRPELEAVRLRSKAKDFGPWKTDMEAMFLKTVIRRMAKYLPTSIEFQRAVRLDEQADAGESQHNEQFLVPESQPLQTKGERIGDKMASKPGDFDYEP